MRMQFSHADYLEELTQKALHALHYEDDYPVDVLASYAGCSESLMYAYVREIPTAGYKMKYIDALRITLARKHKNRRLFAYIEVPVEGNTPTVDTRIDDEVTEIVMGTAKLAAAHRGNNPDAMAEARKEVVGALVRAEGEEMLLRQVQFGPSLPFVGDGK